MVTLASIIILIEIISLSQGIPLLGNYTIHSSGLIDYGARPLRVEGRYIKDDLGRTVYLRGVWKGGFISSCTGWWAKESFRVWNERATRESMMVLKGLWGVNVLNVFFWADWWIDNASTSLGGYATDKPYRYCIKESVRLAQEYGLYFQLRMYGVCAAEGRVEGQPYPPYTNNSYITSVDDFVNFWADFAYEFKDCPNVIFTLFDEPTGNQTLWFETATKTIHAIRAKGIENLIVVHWAYCGSCLWMEQWIQEDRPTHNILFSNHIYRHHGTFEGNPYSSVDREYIKTQLGDNTGSHRAYKYITDTYNIPIWVSAIGAYEGASDDDEYVYFRNTLDVLNEWNLSYAGYMWQLGPHFAWSLLKDDSSYIQPPNRVGQALIDAVAGVPAPPTYRLTINSNLSGVQFILDGITRRTPYGPKPAFEGSHTIIMPSATIVYTHTPLFGNTEIGTGGTGYYPYIYTAGPYTVNETITVSAINLYTMAAGNAKVALYDESEGNPNNLLTESGAVACNASSWNTITVPEVQLTPGKYFIAIKIDTNLMLSSTSKMWFGKYRTHDYALSFPDPFGEVEGGTGAEYSVYIPLAPIQSSTYNFAHWEDGSTNPERTINLTTNMTLTATYELST